VPCDVGLYIQSSACANWKINFLVASVKGSENWRERADQIYDVIVGCPGLKSHRHSTQIKDDRRHPHLPGRLTNQRLWRSAGEWRDVSASRPSRTFSIALIPIDKWGMMWRRCLCPTIHTRCSLAVLADNKTGTNDLRRTAMSWSDLTKSWSEDMTRF